METQESSATSKFLRESHKGKPTRKKLSSSNSSKTIIQDTTKYSINQPNHSKLILSISTDKHQNQSPTKVETVFTKLSEKMFSQIKDNLSLKDCSSYETYINDNILFSYSDKYQHSNAEIIKQFLKRINEDDIRKKLGFNRHQKSISLASININTNDIDSSQANNNNNKSLMTVETRSKASIRFLQNQAKYSAQKEKKLDRLKQYYTNKESKHYRPKPQINLNSEKLSQKHKSKHDYNNIHTKLFHERTNTSQKNYLSLDISDHDSKGKKRVNKKSISVIVDRLFNNKTHVSKEKQFKTSSECVNQPVINEDSSTMLIQRFMHQYDIEMNNVFNCKTEDNVIISYNQFVFLLFKMGFATKNYSNCVISIGKEYNVIQEAWKVLLRKDKKLKSDGKEEREDGIHSHYVLLFFLAILDLYKGKASKEKGINNRHQSQRSAKEQEPATKLSKITSKAHYIKDVPFINEDDYSFDTKLASQMINHFRLLSDNRKEHLDQQQKIIRKKKINKSISNPNLTFKPKTNKKKGNNDISNVYFNKDGGEQKKFSLYEAYEIYRLRKANEIKSSSIKKLAQELKQCTFAPIINKPRSRAISLEEEKKIHSKSTKKLEKTSAISLTESFDMKAKFTFRPQLTEYNSKVFAHNPLSKNKQVTNELERYAKARMGREGKDSSANERNHSLNYLKTSKEAINDSQKIEQIKEFRFDNEVKHNKESFDKFDRSRFDDYHNRHSELLFALEIKIEEEIKMLLYYKGDDTIKKADLFCKGNQLGEDSKKQIIDAINGQINKIKHGKVK